MRFRLNLFLVLSFSAISTICNGQNELVYTTLTTKDGLPSNEVYCLQQDNEGIMWIGTDRGLVRYDGYEMRILTTREGLPDNTILRSYLDYKGRVWCSTYKGGIFYIEKDSIVIPRFNDEIESMSKKFSSLFVSEIYIDSSDVVFLTMNQSINGYLSAKVEGYRITRVEVKANENEHFIFHLENTYKNILITGIGSFQTSNVKSQWKKNQGFDSSMTRILKTYINSYSTYSRHGRVVLGKKGIQGHYLDNELFLYSRNRSISFPSSIISLLCEEELILVSCLEGGLFILDGMNDPRLILKDHIVSTIFKGKEETLWLGTMNNGILHIPSIFLYQQTLKLNPNDLKYRSSIKAKDDTLKMVLKDSLILATLQDSIEYEKYHLYGQLDKNPVVDWIDNHLLLIATQDINGTNLKEVSFKLEPRIVREFLIKSNYPSALNEIVDMADSIILIRSNGYQSLDKAKGNIRN